MINSVGHTKSLFSVLVSLYYGQIWASWRLGNEMEMIHESSKSQKGLWSTWLIEFVVSKVGRLSVEGASKICHTELCQRLL